MELKQNYIINTDDYKVLGKINAGTFGSVLSVQNKMTKEILAAKVSTGISQNLKMTNREIKIMMHFNHPTIAKLVGYSNKDFNNNKNATIFMKLEKNGSLRNAIQLATKGQSMKNYDNTIRQIILIGIARGMMLLHKNHIIHRDLKPENILLDDNLHPIITDFGLSKFYDANHSMNQSMQPGTLIYQAPEILQDDKFNTKADVYAFGILMYEILTEEHPYPDFLNKKMTIPQFTEMITQCDLRPKLNKSIKKSFQKLLEKCWAKNPNDRPTFEEIYNKLAYNFDDFIVNDDDEEDDEDDDDNKYFLPDVDKDDIEDYLYEIENENNLSIEVLNEKILKIEKKIDGNEMEMKKKKGNKQIENEIIIELQNELKTSKNETILLKEKLNSFQTEFEKLRKNFQKYISKYESISNFVEKQNNSLHQENQKLNDYIASIKLEIEKLDKKCSKIPQQITIPDEIYDDIQKAQDLANKANSKYDKMKSENDKLKNDVGCIKYEVKRLKENPPQITIPDEIYDSIQKAQDSANKANSKCDKLKSENDKLKNDVGCSKYEVKRLKENPPQITIPDEIYDSIQKAQDLANKANSKCDKLKSENDKLKNDVGCIKYEVKRLKS